MTLLQSYVLCEVITIFKKERFVKIYLQLFWVLHYVKYSRTSSATTLIKDLATYLFTEWFLWMYKNMKNWRSMSNTYFFFFIYKQVCVCKEWIQQLGLMRAVLTNCPKSSTVHLTSPHSECPSQCCHQILVRWQWWCWTTRCGEALNHHV